MLKKMLEADPDIEVLAPARDGVDVVQKAREFLPDVITMDVNMPGQDGITALQHIVNERICPVVMVSSLTQEGAVTTFEALELGAFDFVAKPGGTVSSNMEEAAGELIAKVKAAAKGRKKQVTSLLARTRTRQVQSARPTVARGKISRAVAIGISTGGPKTIYEVLPLIPPDINAALFLVQHMPANFTSSYVKRLNEACQVDVVEAQAGMKVQPGVVYVGSGGHHLNLFKNSQGDILLRLPTKPDHLFIPSVGVMMQSVLYIFGRHTIGVLMTGMGDDGADAMAEINRAGGITIAESEESAIVFGMPAEAIKRGGGRVVAPAWEIAEQIIRAVERL
jgi:two-component system chemotaxis response regulator CheB